MTSKAISNNMNHIGFRILFEGALSFYAFSFPEIFMKQY